MPYEKRKPCAECPFARATPPGATGGAEPTVYIGQAVGPFFLPCHMDPKYEENHRSTEVVQCAGAAAFRANVGVDVLMPEALLRTDADRERVFATPAELLAHHGQMSLAEAEVLLALFPPEMLLRREMVKRGCQVVEVPQQRRKTPSVRKP
jgi:hypothetical protein